ncbi:hypothetical protein IJT17_00860 [bacterium]|nr:hypothetical protein [bacterium]
MSDAKKTEQNAGSANDLLAKEVSDLEGVLQNTLLPREKLLNTGLKIRIGLLIFAFCYCSFLYYLAYTFTAEQAVMMMRGQLEIQLPNMKHEAIENMKQAAPSVVDGYAKNMVASIPDLRQRLQTEILKTTEENIQSIENGINEMCTQMLTESKAEFDKMGDKMTTAEKIDRLSKEMRVKMFEESRSVVDGIAQEYTGKVREVTTEIKRLQTSPNLTAKEKHQKEMLRISSKLMQMKLKDVNKDFQQVTEELSKQISAEEVPAETPAEIPSESK